MRARLDDDPRRLQRRPDIRCAAERPRLAGDCSHVSNAVDAVLNREDGCTRTEEGFHQRHRRGIVVGLHRHEHDVDRADERRVFLGAGLCHEIAQWTADLQSAIPDGGQMRAARDERNVMSGATETCPVIAADRARSENREFHG